MAVTMDLYDIVTTLAGPVQPTGDHGEDTRRLANLKVLTDMLERVLVDVRDAARCANRPEESMRRIGAYANDFINDIAEAQ